MCQKSGKAEYKGRQTLVFWVRAQEIPGGKPEIWLALPIRSLPHDLVTGGIPHAGSRQSILSQGLGSCLPPKQAAYSNRKRKLFALHFGSLIWENEILIINPLISLIHSPYHLPRLLAVLPLPDKGKELWMRLNIIFLDFTYTYLCKITVIQSKWKKEKKNLDENSVPGLTEINNQSRTSLLVQWLRICLPVQGTRVPSLVRDHRATSEAHMPRAQAPQQEKPLQWEAHTPQLEKVRAQHQRPSTAKVK